MLVFKTQHGIGKRQTLIIFHIPMILWGTATAAHQVEGGHTNNNWFWWESQKR